MKQELPWGWWRASEADPHALAPVIADWMEQQGQPAWARWFRESLDSAQRIERFFGPERRSRERDGMSWRVLVGALPLHTPNTRCEGPWFETLHVILDGSPDTPGPEELAGVPCMAQLRHLVVHTAPLDASAEATPPSRHFRFTDALPLASTLRGVWALDSAPDPVGLEALTNLTHLQTRLGPGTWSHPGVRSLHTWVTEEVGTLDFPALRRLDIEGTEGSIHPLLEQATSVELLEIDAAHGEAVVRARTDGHLPSLQTLRIWGDAPHPPGVVVEQLASYTRESIRRTSDWVMDRALRLGL